MDGGEFQHSLKENVIFADKSKDGEYKKYYEDKIVENQRLGKAQYHGVSNQNFYMTMQLKQYNKEFQSIILFNCGCYSGYRDFKALFIKKISYMCCTLLPKKKKDGTIILIPYHRIFPIMLGSTIDLSIRKQFAPEEYKMFGAFIIGGMITTLPSFISNNTQHAHVYTDRSANTKKYVHNIHDNDHSMYLSYTMEKGVSPIIRSTKLKNTKIIMNIESFHNSEARKIIREYNDPKQIDCNVFTIFLNKYIAKRAIDNNDKVRIRNLFKNEDVKHKRNTKRKFIATADDYELPTFDSWHEFLNKCRHLQKFNIDNQNIPEEQFIRFFDAMVANALVLDKLENKNVLNAVMIFKKALDRILKGKNKTPFQIHNDLKKAFHAGNLYFAVNSNSDGVDRLVDNLKSMYQVVEGHQIDKTSKNPVIKRKITDKIKNAKALLFQPDANFFMCPLKVKEMRSAGQQSSAAQLTATTSPVRASKIIKFLNTYAEKKSTNFNCESREWFRLVFDGYLTNYHIKRSFEILKQLKQDIKMCTFVIYGNYLVINTMGCTMVKYSYIYNMLISAWEKNNIFKDAFVNEYNVYSYFSDPFLTMDENCLSANSTKLTVSLNNNSAACSLLDSRLAVNTFLYRPGSNGSIRYDDYKRIHNINVNEENNTIYLDYICDDGNIKSIVYIKSLSSGHKPKLHEECETPTYTIDFNDYDKMIGQLNELKRRASLIDVNQLGKDGEGNDLNATFSYNNTILNCPNRQFINEVMSLNVNDKKVSIPIDFVRYNVLHRVRDLAYTGVSVKKLPQKVEEIFDAIDGAIKQEEHDTKPTIQKDETYVNTLQDTLLPHIDKEKFLQQLYEFTESALDVENDIAYFKLDSTNCTVQFSNVYFDSFDLYVATPQKYANCYNSNGSDYKEMMMGLKMNNSEKIKNWHTKQIVIKKKDTKNNEVKLFYINRKNSRLFAYYDATINNICNKLPLDKKGLVHIYVSLCDIHGSTVEDGVVCEKYLNEYSPKKYICNMLTVHVVPKENSCFIKNKDTGEMVVVNKKIKDCNIKYQAINEDCGEGHILYGSLYSNYPLSFKSGRNIQIKEIHKKEVYVYSITNATGNNLIKDIHSYMIRDGDTVTIFVSYNFSKAAFGVGNKVCDTTNGQKTLIAEVAEINDPRHLFFTRDGKIVKTQLYLNPSSIFARESVPMITGGINSKHLAVNEYGGLAIPLIYSANRIESADLVKVNVKIRNDFLTNFMSLQGNSLSAVSVESRGNANENETYKNLHDLTEIEAKQGIHLSFIPATDYDNVVGDANKNILKTIT